MNYDLLRLWACGGMVDAEDLKSFGYCNRVGSSPTRPTTILYANTNIVQRKSYGVVAQLIERYVRIVEVVGLSPISSTTVFQKIYWAYGGIGRRASFRY